MDRNCLKWRYITQKCGRTPQECVDRNLVVFDIITFVPTVALHRSAWIEMLSRRAKYLLYNVALHRSAWIEIPALRFCAPCVCVALHRSAWIEIVNEALNP